MGRLAAQVRERVEVFGDRMLDVVLALESRKVYKRVVDQMVGCGTSVGANACEADQAMSAPDFCKALGVALKELGESGYWLRLCARRAWLRSDRLELLQQEAIELSRIFGAMITRTRRRKSK